MLRDLKSTNGTMVNGARVTEAALEDGAAVQIGATVLVYRIG
jgi:pSer/pThr/pTyr-binding forkhead associated (FHA) protein